MDAVADLGPGRCSSGLEEARARTGSRGHGKPQVCERGRRRDPPSRRPLEQTLLEEERLVDVLDGLRLLGDRDRERVEPYGLTGERRAQRGENRAVDLVEPSPVHLEQPEGGPARLPRPPPPPPPPPPFPPPPSPP